MLDVLLWLNQWTDPKTLDDFIKSQGVIVDPYYELRAPGQQVALKVSQSLFLSKIARLTFVASLLFALDSGEQNLGATCYVSHAAAHLVLKH